MYINSVNTNQPQFKAKFLDTYAIRKVAQWAVENGKFEQLNEARKRIDGTAVQIRIELTIAENLENGYPIAIFRRYVPKSQIIDDKLTTADFIVSRPITYQSRRKVNPYEYGFERIIQMSNYISQNKMFREIVIHPPRYFD